MPEKARAIGSVSSSIFLPYGNVNSRWQRYECLQAYVLADGRVNTNTVHNQQDGS